ncbi:MAG: hypothetical protein RR359_04285 [Bacilli bacterium]
MERNNTSQILLSILGVAILVVAVVGVSFAFFTFTGEGQTVNTVTAGTLTFAYSDATAAGNGIAITNAVPISDADGIALKDASNVFNFNVTAVATGTAIAYEVFAVKVSTPATDLPDTAVKLYLKHGDTDATVTKEAPLTISAPNTVKKYSELGLATDKVNKLLYSGSVPKNTASYSQFFQLRMWLSSDVVMGNSDINGRSFKVKINVKANNA